jgi:hypothetical protein
VVRIFVSSVHVSFVMIMCAMTQLWCKRGEKWDLVEIVVSLPHFEGGKRMSHLIWVIVLIFLTREWYCINSPSMMEPTRSPIWRVNEWKITLMFWLLFHVNVFLLPYEHYKHTWMIKWQVCHSNVVCGVVCGLWLYFWPMSFMIIYLASLKVASLLVPCGSWL